MKSYYEDEILQLLKENFPNDDVIQHHLTKKEIKRCITEYTKNVIDLLLSKQVVRINHYFSLYLKSKKFILTRKFKKKKEELLS